MKISVIKAFWLGFVFVLFLTFLIGGVQALSYNYVYNPWSSVAWGHGQYYVLYDSGDNLTADNGSFSYVCLNYTDCRNTWPGAEGQKNGSGPYLYNDTESIFFNESYMNITVSSGYVSRTDWTTQDDYPSDCNATSFTRGLGDALNCEEAYLENSSGYLYYTGKILSFYDQYLNNTIDDFATAGGWDKNESNDFYHNGSRVATGNFDMGGFNITNIGLVNTSNITVTGRITQNDYYIRSVSTGGKATGDALAIYMNGTTGDFLPHFILQPGGVGQMSSIVRSFGILNETVSFLNNTNRTDCQAYFDAVGEILQIDCDTSGTGADLMVGDDMQVIGDIWVKDTDGDWHFLTRTLQELDRTFDDIVFNELVYGESVTGGVYNFSFVTESGDTIVVNIDTLETILDISSDTITLSNGTESVPKINHIFYQDKNDPTLTVSATHPEQEHADIGRVLLGNITGSDANVYAWVDALSSNYEFVFGVAHRFFDMGALYESGFTPTVTASDISITNGSMIQVLSDIATTNNVSISSDRYYTILNDGTFKMCDDMTCITEYTTGENIGNNKHFNIVWGVVPNASNTTRLIAVPQNKPATEWNTLAAAETDTSFLLYFPGNDLVKKTMIPVARTIVRKGTDQNQVLSNGQRFFDIRGTLTGGGGNAPSPSITDHSALSSLTWSTAGHTIDSEINMTYNNITSGWSQLNTPWEYLFNYASPCNSTSYIRGVDDTLTCVENTYSENSSYLYYTGKTLDVDVVALNQTIDQRDSDTTYTATGDLLDLTGTVFSVNEGTLTDERVCEYESTGTQLECTLVKDGSGDCASGAVCLGDHTHSVYAPLDSPTFTTAFTATGLVDDGDVIDNITINTTAGGPDTWTDKICIGQGCINWMNESGLYLTNGTSYTIWWFHVNATGYLVWEPMS